jgi:hypothetical protein
MRRRPEINGYAATTDEQEKIDGRDIQLAFLFGRITDSNLGQRFIACFH